MRALWPDSPTLFRSFGSPGPRARIGVITNQGRYHGDLAPTSNSRGLGEDFQSVISESPSASAASRGYNLQQRPRAGGTRLTHLRVTTSSRRFTEVFVFDLPETATGGAVLNRLRLGGRLPGGPGSDYARYLCSPPSDRSPTQDPPARPGASQKDTAGSPGYNLWITRQIVHRQPALLYAKITGSRHLPPQKGVSQAK